jgi:hypothetical protein
LWNKQDTIRYDTGALGVALHEVVMMKGKTNG